MFEIRWWAGVWMCMLMGVAAGAGAPKSAPPLPEETLTEEVLPPADGQRLYVTDPTFQHMVDGRLYVYEGRSGKFLGMIGTGFGALVMPAADGKDILVTTTYYPRLSRGERADVVEVHDAHTLRLKAEIDIPPKRAQGLSYRGMLAMSHDGRWLWVQNATPASSVTVVDLVARKFVGEIPTPGCWGLYAWNHGARLSTVCGDGSLLTLTLNEQGQVQQQERSTPFFNPDQDPIFTHAERMGDDLYFVSYKGQVYTVHLKGEAVGFSDPWSLGAKKERGDWRPGGLQISALHQASQTLFVNMHPKGYEGSHKSPGQEVWVVDLKTRQRTARVPVQHPTSITVSQGVQAQLYLLNLEKAMVQTRAVTPGYPVLKNITGVGETSMFMEVR